MDRYIKKPEIVRARQWDGKDHEDVVVNHSTQTPRAVDFNNDKVLIPMGKGLVKDSGDIIGRGDYIVHEGGRVHGHSAEDFEAEYDTFENIFGADDESDDVPSGGGQGGPGTDEGGG